MLDLLIKKPASNPDEPCTLKVSDRADKPVKSIMKSVSWRIVGTIDTMIISYLITGKMVFAISIGSAEVITKTVLYYFHERLWAHIHQIKIKWWPRFNSKKYAPERAE